MTRQTNDTRVSAAEHLDGGAAAQPKFLQLVDMVRMAKNLGDAGAAANGKLVQRDRRAVCWLFHGAVTGILRVFFSLQAATASPDCMPLCLTRQVRVTSSHGEP